VQDRGRPSPASTADQQINALLDTMQTKNYGRVLAKPKILVNDNEPGNIKTADTPT
jgi:general secretion pathway protein D